MSQPAVLLVHGAWHGAWAWQGVVDRLTAADVAVEAVDLPSSGNDPRLLGDLAADAEVVEQALAAIEGDVVLVGHSYGGMPITQAAADNVVHLVYLAAFMLEEGESLIGALGGNVPGELVADGAATRFPTPHETFYTDVDRVVADQAVERLQLQSVSSFAGELTHAAWTDTPSTYLLATQDRAIPRRARRRCQSGQTPFTASTPRTRHSCLAPERSWPTSPGSWPPRPERRPNDRVTGHGCVVRDRTALGLPVVRR